MFWEGLLLAAAASKTIRKILFRAGLFVVHRSYLGFIVFGFGITLHWWGPMPPLPPEAILIRDFPALAPQVMAVELQRTAGRRQSKRESSRTHFPCKELRRRSAFSEKSKMAVQKAKQNAWHQKAKPSQMRALRFVTAQMAERRTVRATSETPTQRPRGILKSKKR